MPCWIYECDQPKRQWAGTCYKAVRLAQLTFGELIPPYRRIMPYGDWQRFAQLFIDEENAPLIGEQAWYTWQRNRHRKQRMLTARFRFANAYPEEIKTDNPHLNLSNEIDLQILQGKIRITPWQCDVFSWYFPLTVPDVQRFNYYLSMLTEITGVKPSLESLADYPICKVTASTRGIDERLVDKNYYNLFLGER